MRTIELTNSDSLCMVDDVDYDYLIELCKWNDDGKGYIRSSKLFGGERLKLHRIVAARMGLSIDGLHVHHIDENPLNNQRNNLETKTSSQHITDHNLSREWKYGDAHGNTTISDAVLLAVIDEVMAIGGTQRDMSYLTGLSFAHMGDVVHGRKRAYLYPEIMKLQSRHNWKKGNQNNDDEETLELVQEFLQSGLSFAKFAERSGKISRQHLQNVVAGKRLPHLKEKIDAMR